LSSTTTSGRKVKATNDYQAAEDDELTLKTGDIITVISEESDGWLKGENKGNIGIFPSNFTEEYTEDPVDSMLTYWFFFISKKKKKIQNSI